MKPMFKPAVVTLACLACLSLFSCKTLDSLTNSISSLANQPPAGGGDHSARINEINSKLADIKQTRAKLSQERKLAENQRNECIFEMSKITGFGPKRPSGEMFNETLTIDPGMIYVMHDRNLTAATNEISRIDAELNQLNQEEANLQSERARLEENQNSRMATAEMAGGGGCFSADTDVLLPGGALKPIRHLQEGEQIVVFDEQTGALDVRPVVRTFALCENHYYLLNHSLRVTAMHRFLTDNGWVRVKDLKPGAKLKTRNGWTELETKEEIGVNGDVYNLQIEEHHNFFVTAKGTSYLVHNTGGGGSK